MKQSNNYQSTLPDFSSLTAEKAQSDIKCLVKKQRTAIDNLLASSKKTTFASIVNPIEEMQHELSRIFSPISHLQNVLDQPEWRNTFNSCLPLETILYSGWLERASLTAPDIQIPPGAANG